MHVRNGVDREMSRFKIQMSEFFKGFVTNYTEELSRTSLTPLMQEIDSLKMVHSETMRQNVIGQSK